MRTFLAVFPPPETQAAAHAAGERLRAPADGGESKGFDGVSWVKAENLHYTLRFLGEIGEDGARRAGEAAVRAAAAHSRFAATLGPLGAFPKNAPARVLWVGLAGGGEPFEALAHSLEHELKKVGFGAPDMPFSAHLTLGRVRNPGRDWRERLTAAPSLEGAPDARFQVEGIRLIESTMSPRGSVYRVHVEAPLKG